LKKENSSKNKFIASFVQDLREGFAVGFLLGHRQVHPQDVPLQVVVPVAPVGAIRASEFLLGTALPSVPTQALRVFVILAAMAIISSA
jgi:hypothetical protein